MNFNSDKTLFRPTFATIDLGALAHNYFKISGRLPKRVGIMAMVKADAYGHGAVRVSKVLEKCGVRALGVATVEEGVELRSAGIAAPILVMGGLMGAGSPASKRMVEAGLTPVIHSEGVLDSLDGAAAARGSNIRIHLKIDTGMSRLGIRPESLDGVLKRVKGCKHLSVEGVMTHLADAMDDVVSKEQFDLFSSCRERIESALGRVPIWHVANGAAIFEGKHMCLPDTAECWVRPGLALYGECEGIDPLEGKLKPVMGLKSRAVLLKRIPAGTRVSYCGTFVARRPTKLAIVPIGYADGYPWSVSGKAEALMRGRRVPVVGRVTMDMIIIDVTDMGDAAVNDEVVLLGDQGGGRITVREFAGWAGTIPYEILCGISKRMPRVYMGETGC